MPYISEHFLRFSKEVEGRTGVYTVQYGENMFSDGDKKDNKREWSCSCPDFKYNKRPISGYCRHIDETMTNNSRCLWVGTDTESPLYSGLTVPLLKQARVASSSDDLEQASKNLKLILDSLIAYVPYFHKGELVRAKFVSDDDWNDNIKPDDYVDAENLQYQGLIWMDKFLLILNLIETRSEESLQACYQAGIDPTGEFEIVGENPDLDTLHNKCGMAMVDLYGNKDAYVCVNPECFNGLNHPQNIAARRETILQIIDEIEAVSVN